MNNETSRLDMKVRLEDEVAVAGALTNAIQVPDGEIWRLLWAQHSHNSVGAQTGFWTLTLKGGSPYVLGEAQSVGANVRRHLYTDLAARDSLILRGGDVLTSNFVAMDGAAQITVQYCAEVIQGEALG